MIGRLRLLVLLILTNNHNSILILYNYVVVKSKYVLLFLCRYQTLLVTNHYNHSMASLVVRRVWRLAGAALVTATTMVGNNPQQPEYPELPNHLKYTTR